MTDRADPPPERTPLEADASLAQRAAAGDRDAFESIVRTHTDGIWRVTRALLHDDGAAEEATQDTFVRAHGALGSFRGDSSLKTWLTVIARRISIDRLRLARLDTTQLPEDDALAPTSRSGGGAVPMADRTTSAVALGGHLDGLAADHREAFLLVDVLGYTAADAAEIVDVPASTLRSRVATARRQLADALHAEDPDWLEAATTGGGDDGFDADRLSTGGQANGVGR